MRLLPRVKSFGPWLGVALTLTVVVASDCWKDDDTGVLSLGPSCPTGLGPPIAGVSAECIGCFGSHQTFDCSGFWRCFCECPYPDSACRLACNRMRGTLCPPSVPEEINMTILECNSECDGQDLVYEGPPDASPSDGGVDADGGDGPPRRAVDAAEAGR